MKLARFSTVLCLGMFASVAIFCQQNVGKMPIDRKAVVQHYFPHLNRTDTLSSFTVGNGNFAFTADITGLQTFRQEYEKGIPLGTESNWGWHVIPAAKEYTLEDALKPYNTYGRKVTYASDAGSEAGQWLRANPHRLHLGQVGFLFTKENGEPVTPRDIKSVYQKLNLWEGILRSRFSLNGKQVSVETACHPAHDQIAVQMESALFLDGRNGVHFQFPYGTESWGKQSGDWNSPEKHTSKILSQSEHAAIIQRTLDAFTYYIRIRWAGEAQFTQQAAHNFTLIPRGDSLFTFTACFSKDKFTEELPTVDETFRASISAWEQYWMAGGFVDLSGSTDPRAKELERRIILSQYLTAVQCAGDLPPQETGLTCNSWYGKFHLEMHWWHGVHFILWNRPELFERSFEWYTTAISAAQKKANRQGYRGVRWPKMVGPDGREGPSGVGVFLIWQQPHPIYYAELLYRQSRDPGVLERCRDIVFQTADFMASYAHWIPEEKRYVLGPPLIPAQEIYDKEATMNPTFELSYWKYGLRVAQLWRKRLGLNQNEKWQHVLDHLSELPMNHGFYQNAETAMNTFADSTNRSDHPTLLGAYGMLPNDDVDVKVMRRTLKQVLDTWSWKETWGWDFPLTAMTAPRVGEPELAIDALLMDTQKNTYLNNGHNYQDNRLTLYLPGNGGLLTAVAMMAAGWHDAPNRHAPGFPDDDSWVVRYENLAPLP